MQRLLQRFSVVSLVFIFLVILAGSIVRMTGSGMGCPDWPKCFGYYIPPTDISVLLWEQQREFDKGNAIIRNDSLFVANFNFTSGESYDSSNWSHYTKHDYAIFNPYHTWIEFINRLIGALTGIPVLILFILSIFYFKKDKLVFYLSAFGLFFLGFEAWLGKTVVDGNLEANQITYHMLGALCLVAIYSFLSVYLSNLKIDFKAKRDRAIVILGFLSLGLMLTQILLGTGVRELVDTIGKENLLLGNDWLDTLGVKFYIHRSFSILVLIAIIVFSVKVINTRTISTWPRILVISIFLEILIGMGLAYLDMPSVLQPLHLFSATINFSLIVLVLSIYFRKTA